MDEKEMIKTIYNDVQELKQQVQEIRQALKGAGMRLEDTVITDKKMQVLMDTAEDSLF